MSFNFSLVQSSSFNHTFIISICSIYLPSLNQKTTWLREQVSFELLEQQILLFNYIHVIHESFETLIYKIFIVIIFFQIFLEKINYVCKFSPMRVYQESRISKHEDSTKIKSLVINYQNVCKFHLKLVYSKVGLQLVFCISRFSPT